MESPESSSLGLHAKQVQAASRCFAGATSPLTVATRASSTCSTPSGLHTPSRSQDGEKRHLEPPPPPPESAAALEAAAMMEQVSLDDNDEA